MADSTAVVYEGRREIVGRRKVVDYAIDLTQGTEGYAMTAGSGPFTEWKQFYAVIDLGCKETKGYVLEFVPTVTPSADNWSCGDGVLWAKQISDGATTAAALDVFMIRIEGC